jgi:hypothetical protein
MKTKLLALLTIFLLLPIPAFAMFQFGTWLFTSNDQTGTGGGPWTSSASPDNATLSIFPTTNESPPSAQTISLATTVTWNGQGSNLLTATGFNLSGLHGADGSTNLEFSIAVYDQSGNFLGNIFDATRRSSPGASWFTTGAGTSSIALQQGQPYTLDVTFNFTSATGGTAAPKWEVASPSSLTVAFGP